MCGITGLQEQTNQRHSDILCFAQVQVFGAFNAIHVSVLHKKCRKLLRGNQFQMLQLQISIASSTSFHSTANACGPLSNDGALHKWLCATTDLQLLAPFVCRVVNLPVFFGLCCPNGG